MKLMGVILTLVGAAFGFQTYRQTVAADLALLRGLIDDLAVLRSAICIHRRALPIILRNDLSRGSCSVAVWIALAEMLEQGRGTVAFCWCEVVSTLPPQLSVLLAPLGVLIADGGDLLAHVLDQVRDELIVLRQQREKEQRERLRLTGAMLFSAAALFLIVAI